LGASPIFVDIDPVTLCIDPAGVFTAITSQTKAIMPVHFGGFAVDIDVLRAVVSSSGRENISIVEDAAHALPSTLNGKLVGSLNSEATVFSFYSNKTITTGEGGMLVTKSKSIAARAKIMRLHGISRDAFDRFTSNKPSWFYEVVAPGYKYNMTDIAASLGIHQLRKARFFQSRRAQIASLYDDALIDLPVILPPRPRSCELHSWHLYVVRLLPSAPVSRDEFIDKLYLSGIGCSVHYIPLHLHPYWRDAFSLSPSMFPISQSVYESSVSLPIYSKMTDDDVQRVIDAVGIILRS